VQDGPKSPDFPSGKLLTVVALTVAAIAAWRLRSEVATSDPARTAIERPAAAPRKEGTAAVSPPGIGDPATAAAPAHSLAEILTEKDPFQAFALYAARVQQLKPGEFGGELTALMALRKPEQKDTFLQLLLQQWGRLEPLAGIAALDQLRGPGGLPLMDGDTMKYKNLVLRGWVIDRPEEAWQWTLANRSDFDDYVARQMRLGTPGGRGGPLTQEENRAALYEGQIRQRLATSLLPALTESRQFEVAAKLLGETPDLTAGTQLILLRSLALAWSASDVTAAAQWLNSQVPAGAPRAEAISGFVEAATRDEPGVAAAFVKGLSNPDELKAGAVAMVKGFAAQGARAASFEWLQGAVGDNAGGVFDQAILEQARSPATQIGSPAAEAAERNLIAKVADPTQRKNAVGSYVRRTIAKNPLESIAAAQQLLTPEDYWRDYRSSSQSIGSILTTWATNDYAAASAYAGSLTNLTPAQQELVDSSLALGKRTSGK
jgi:hypothetical protein